MKTDLITYQKMTDDVYASVSQAVGSHVMLLIVEQALWKTKYKYQEGEKIVFSEEGISLEGLNGLEPQLACSIAHEFIMGMVATLGLLVGVQIANQLLEQLKVKTMEDSRSWNE